MKISLLMVTSQGNAKEVPVTKLPVIIGRGAECKLRIPVDSVSRNHCELLENDDEELVVRDLKSSNGTFVNKQRVKEKELVPGDLLSIGPVVFVVRIDGHPRDVDPTTAFSSGAVAVGGGAPAMIDGVPTWTGTPTPPSSAKPTTAQKPAAKPGAKSANDDSDAFDDLLKDLSESDFDIDFGDDDSTKKSPPNKK